MIFAALLVVANALIPGPSPPLMGFSTWNCFGLEISESLMAEVADALLSSGLAAAGYTFVNLDDGWAAYNRTVAGDLVGDPVKFPSGMAALGSLLHDKGLHYGLYTSRATRTCSGAMPGSLGNEAKDATVFSSWGVDFLKNDDCHVVYANAYQDYGAMEHALAQVPRAIFHNTKAPDLNATVASLVTQSRRVTKDLKNTWEDMVRLVDAGNDQAFQALPGRHLSFFNDFDMLEVGNKADANPAYAPVMTLTEWQAHFSLWAAFKSPLILGNDIRSMTNDVLSILTNKEVIAVNQDALGAQAKLISRSFGDTLGIKTTLSACNNTSPDQQWVLEPVGGGGHLHVRLATTNSCLELWQGQRRWPWWIAVGPCNTSDPNQLWAWGSNSSGGGATLRLPAAAAACWPGVGGVKSPTTECCLVAEGANPELDGCDWMTDISRQLWHLQPGLKGSSHIVSAYHGQCLAVNGGLEVYAGPLAGGNYTAVLFNRSPAPANISLDFAALAQLTNSAPFVQGAVRNLLTHADLGVFQNAFTALVSSHGVVHVNVAPLV